VKRRRNAPGILAALTLQLSCLDIAPVDLGVCGNGVQEADEYCDSFSIGATPCRDASAPLPCTLDCSDVACPEGYACGSDATCRRASDNEFEVSSSTIAASGRLAAGDFDCDGADSLIVTDDLEGPSTSVPRVLSPWPQPSLVSLGYPVSQTTVLASRSGRCDDVVGPWTTAAPLSARSGLLVLEGVEARGLVPRAQLSIGVTTTGDVVAVRRGSAEAHGSPIFFESLDGQGQLIAADLDDAPRVVAIAPRGPEALAVRPFVADSPVTPCERVFLAFTSPPAVWWVDPCAEDGSWRTQATGELSELPVTSSLSGAAVADVDADGGTDLVASTADGAFWWRSLDVDAEWRKFSIEFEGPPGIGPGRLLAAANPADGEAILVTERLLLRGTIGDGSFAGQTLSARVVGTWSQALTVDLDGDDLLDVALATTGARDVDVFRWVPGGQPPNPEAITTSGVVQQLIAGDFDGDKRIDLALLEETDPTSQLDLVLARGGGVPDFAERVLVSSFGAGARATSVRADRDDSIADLVVVGPAEGGSESRVFFGDGGGVPLSPLRLGGASATATFAAPLLAAVRSGANPELLVLGFDLESTAGPGIALWRSARLATGSWDSLAPVGTVEGLAFDIVAGDPTFALAVDPSGFTWVMGSDVSGEANLRVAKIDEGSNGWTMRWAPDVGALTRGSALVLPDFDVADDRIAALAVGTEAASLAVFRTDSDSDPQVLDDLLLGVPRAIAWLPSPQGPSSLLVATTAGVEWLGVDENGQWEAKNAIVGGVTTTRVIVDGAFLSVAVGDWDGDGVRDIAASTEERIQIVWGVAEVPNPEVPE
jgi:hypothetical protein